MTEAQEYLNEARSIFRAQKELADKALSQLSDAELFYLPDAESNSIAVIMKHLAGNMISRWTNFLTADGEKPDRHRDNEFIASDTNASAIKSEWEKGYAVLFQTLDSLHEDDLMKIVTIRREPHTVIKAIFRQIAHYG